MARCMGATGFVETRRREFLRRRPTLGLTVPKFCSECGSSDIRVVVPERDERERAVCGSCGTTHYENPKVVVGCVVETRAGYLMAKRSIEPRRGFWGFPQGYMENGESTKECAAREILEETGASVSTEAMTLLALYNLPNQVQIVYQAKVDDIPMDELPESTKESSEVRLFTYEQLPADLAFPTVRWAIDFSRDRGKKGDGSDGDGDDFSLGNVIQQYTKAYDHSSGQWALRRDD
eukprot:CAMPEP_0118917858 /NCGR_PEP_ID=MMETSP1166-20130328/17571_1 /TAXON_ID=1104430 /ORGANISM="Chrysoreinhardia sp, Strain CCMP3193" /LENGTH=234 /DNA_ID=CAMNT_0006858081 /DNA_START=138 /DNA_END=842 /DNA_ORIENTATION=-